MGNKVNKNHLMGRTERRAERNREQTTNGRGAAGGSGRFGGLGGEEGMRRQQYGNFGLDMFRFISQSSS